MDQDFVDRIHGAYCNADEKELDNLWKQAPKSFIKFFSGKYSEDGENVFLNTVFEKKIWMSSPRLFNDPFDCAMNIDSCKEFDQMLFGTIPVSAIFDTLKDDSLFKKYEAVKKKHQDVVSANKDFVEKSLHVSCFSEKDKLHSLRMWGYYANSHQGFCAEYAFDDVKNASPSGCIPVLYTDTYELNDKGRTQEERTRYILNLAFRKSFEWSFEKEWRIMHDEYKNYGLAGYASPIELPKKLYLGCKAKRKLKQEAEEMCKLHKVELYQAYMKPGTFELGFERIV